MKYFILLTAIALLLYTRFVNLPWGLPYPFHPDERNMAVAITQFTCHLPGMQIGIQNFIDCLNPHFFAYGQMPLYLAYAMILAAHWFKSLAVSPTFQEAVISLRIISAVSSVLTFFFLVKILDNIFDSLEENRQSRSSVYRTALTYLFLIFSPVLIQFAHFGTTESVLILLYVVLVYISLKVLKNHDFLNNYLVLSGIICGLSLATKLSSLVYFALPVYCLLHDSKSIDNFFTRIIYRIVSLSRVVVTALIFGILLSPYNLIKLEDFYGSFQYESSVGLGTLNVFYTRQFFGTTPFLFQFDHIFPYALGYGVFIMSIAGFLFLPWKNRYLNLLRISFLLVFVPNAYVYAKWTRFIAPAYPIMLSLAVLFMFHFLKGIRNFLEELKSFQADKSDGVVIKSIGIIICIISIIPGLAYLSIYQTPDVRFIASDWIYKNIPNDSKILAETANVVDIPIPSPQKLESHDAAYNLHYNYVSFNFYDLDTESPLQNDLPHQIEFADYIFIPSRRIFANHTCYEIVNTEIKLQKYMDKRCQDLLKKYPLLNEYYGDLFGGKSGFIKVAEFSSYPRIELFGVKILEFPDENAEETWTVFDHPVIRIYKKV